MTTRSYRQLVADRAARRRSPSDTSGSARLSRHTRLEQPAPADGACVVPSKRAVRHHDVPLGRADGPAHRRLVARVIDAREPVPRAIGPVVAEPGPSVLLSPLARSGRHAAAPSYTTRTRTLSPAPAGSGTSSELPRVRRAAPRVRSPSTLRTVHRVDEIETQRVAEGARSAVTVSVAAQDRRTRVGKHERVRRSRGRRCRAVARAG